MKTLIALSALGFLVLSRGHTFADECEPSFVSTRPASGLWAYKLPTDDSLASMSGTWIKLGETSTLTLTSIKSFAYVGRQTPVVADHQGATSIKFIRFATNENDHLQQVSLRRSTLGSTCGLPWLLQFISLPLDFIVGQQVDAADYIAYHAADSGSNSTLQRFHVNYQSEKDKCISTDSTRGNRRTAFLAEYDGRTVPARDEVIAALKNALAPSVALASPGHSAGQQNNTLRLPKVLAHEAKAFGAFATFKSQIQTYNLSGTVCVAFSDFMTESNQWNPLPNRSCRSRRYRWLKWEATSQMDRELAITNWMPP